MKAPTRLYISQGTMFIDAVVAEQVVGQLFDPTVFGRVGVDLCQALTQEPGSLRGVSGPSGFSNRLTRLVILDPEEGTARLGVDGSLSSMTSALMFHGISPLEAVGNAEFGHTMGTRSG